MAFGAVLLLPFFKKGIVPRVVLVFGQFVITRNCDNKKTTLYFIINKACYEFFSN